jgi:hypothetical protein
VGKTINGKYYVQGNAYFTTPEFYIKHRSAFFKILVECYQRFKKPEIGGIDFSQAPLEVQQNTERFLENQNVFHKVFESQYVVVDDKTKTLKVKDIWDALQTSEEYKHLPKGDRRLYNREKFLEYLKERADVKEPNNRPAFVLGVEMRYKDEDTDETPVY